MDIIYQYQLQGVEFEWEEEKARSNIADHGVTFEEAAEVFFDPFYQVDSSSTREHGGAGLGLSIVKRIVEAHGGTISIEDNVPQGTIFVVKIPSASSAPIMRRSSLPPPMPAQ